MIVVTQVKTKKRIALWPTHFILHQPRKTQIITKKPAFQITTLMSILAPQFCEEVQESYESVKREILYQNGHFAEFTHGKTGTKFLLSPAFFTLQEPGCIAPTFNDVFKETSLVSLWNPAVWVPIAESFDDACILMSTVREKNG